MPIRTATAALALLAATALPSWAACPSDAAVDALAADYLAMRPATMSEPPRTMDDAACAQAKLIERLGETLGPPIGYKVGLTSEGAQKRFGASEPVMGRLFGPLEQTGATVAPFAARGLYEADLLVRVASDEINKATTPMEVLQHLSVVRPFIELADLVVAEGQPINPATITGFNVGARTGVVGPSVDVEATDEFLEALGSMTVRMEKLDGDTSEEVFAVPGSAILGHPLEAVLWLMNSGVKLEPNDLVSLGSFGAPSPARPGDAVKVSYEGLLDEPVTVEMRLGD